MSWCYRHLVRPVLFTQDPEQIHNRTMAALGWVGRHNLISEAFQSFFAAPEMPIEVFGLNFPNPVGLAAGMDKQAEALPAWEALGFGFTELGAVTWHPQPGNPAPRVFRAIEEEAIVNRMGFNNFGAVELAHKCAWWREQNRWPAHPVGINLGKSKITPLEKAAEDYADSFRVLLPHLDFFVVNVSSPNTPNLRLLQDKSALDDILSALQSLNQPATLPPPAQTQATSNPAKPKPILVKIAPDLSFEAIDEVLEVAVARRVAGIVATNTTITRPQTTDPAVSRIYSEAGGLSGRPLRARSTEVIRHIYRETRGDLPIVGVGGIFSARDAWEKIAAGASVVQLYTSLVYEGPGAVKRIVRGLWEHLEQAGLRELRQAIGVENS
jgi:dihydroorotate dehydrogenase